MELEASFAYLCVGATDLRLDCRPRASLTAAQHSSLGAIPSSSVERHVGLVHCRWWLILHPLRSMVRRVPAGVKASRSWLALKGPSRPCHVCSPIGPKRSTTSIVDGRSGLIGRTCVPQGATRPGRDGCHRHRARRVALWDVVPHVSRLGRARWFSRLGSQGLWGVGSPRQADALADAYMEGPAQTWLVLRAPHLSPM